MDLSFATIAEAAELIRARKLSPVEYTELLLQRIAALEPQLNAFIAVTGDIAREQARKAEQELMTGHHRGPLHGIPFALKDIYATQGIPTTGGSKVGIGNVPSEDATTVRLLREAGAVLLGKLQLHEFAHGGPSFDLPWPPARNPWDLERFTGGSSSGSGAALAAGLVPGSLGSDTGSSIRNPASLCGVVGLKPTTGLVSRAGVVPNSFTLDHCGPMARTVEDCAILLQAIAGHDPADPGSARARISDYRAALTGDVRGMRIGVLRHYWEEDVAVHPDHARAMESAIDVFRHLGAQVEDCRGRPVQDYFETKILIGESEIYSVHYDNLRSRAGDFGRDFLGRILPACLFHATDYVQAAREQRRMIAEMTPLYANFDVLLTIGLGPAPRLDENRTSNYWTTKSEVFRPTNLTGGPSLVLPVGFSGGLPMGMQVSGRPFDEATVLRAGHAFERATEWHRRRPDLITGVRQPVIQPTPYKPQRPDLDDATRALVLRTAHDTGLRLDDAQQAMLLEAAPHALDIAQRIRKPRDRMDMPAAAFRLR